MHILIVEDERVMVEVLQTGLEEVGHTVDLASDGVEGEQKVLTGSYDLLIVDWRLPRMDGRTMIERLRATGYTAPILMLTARTDVEDRVNGLDAGADDYLTKPFAFEELFARVRALSRRPTGVRTDAIVRAGPVEIDTRRRQVLVAGERINLQPKEYALLELLARRQDSVVTRTLLAETIWGSVAGVSEDVINMTVSRLRHQLQEALPHDQKDALQIQTVRGVGYRLIAE